MEWNAWGRWAGMGWGGVGGVWLDAEGWCEVNVVVVVVVVEGERESKAVVRYKTLPKDMQA